MIKGDLYYGKFQTHTAGKDLPHKPGVHTCQLCRSQWPPAHPAGFTTGVRYLGLHQHIVFNVCF